MRPVAAGPGGGVVLAVVSAAVLVHGAFAIGAIGSTLSSVSRTTGPGDVGPPAFGCRERVP